jgi:hypothetical protein
VASSRLKPDLVAITDPDKVAAQPVPIDARHWQQAAADGEWLMSARVLAGKCFCGAVEYAVADAFAYAANCHCSNCRRTTGSAFKPFAGIGRDQLELIKGEADLTIYGEPNGNDTHCARCGSLLYSVVRDGAYVHVAMGTLVDDPTIRPTKHIFVGSKAPWFTITDDLPQFEGHATPGS